MTGAAKDEPRHATGVGGTIGSYEAKTHLPRLLDEGEAGASYSYVWAARPYACPLATRDEKMRQAARAEGIALMG